MIRAKWVQKGRVPRVAAKVQSGHRLRIVVILCCHLVDDSPLRPLCDPLVTTTSPFSFPLLLNPITLTKGKMEIGSDIVDSDEFNLPQPNSMTELRLCLQEVLPVPIIFSMECGHFVDWDLWVDSELQDIKCVNLFQKS